MRLLSFLIYALSILSLCSGCSEKTSIIWAEGAVDPETGYAVHTMTVRNVPEGTDWAVWMTSNYIRSGFVEGTQGEIGLYEGCLYRMTPFEHEGKDLVVKYADIPLQRHCWAPEGFVLEQGGKTVGLDVTYEFLPSERIQDFPYNHVETQPWDMIPSLKSVTPAEGTTLVGEMPEVTMVQSDKAGWQELVMDLEDHVYERLKKNLFGINFWYTGGENAEFPYRYANDGVPVIVSNMTNTYMDFAYNPDKTERGLSWGGFVDERRSYSLLPFDIYRSVRWDDKGRMREIASLPEGRTPLHAKENIIGVSAQLWTETIRCFDHVTYYVFPKVCGLFERGWNASPAWEGTAQADDPVFMYGLDKYYSTVVSNEMPYYESMGIAYRKRR